MKRKRKHREAATSAATSVPATDTTSPRMKPPDNLSQAIVHFVWSLAPWLRTVTLIVSISIVGVFVLWKTLPDAIRTDMLREGFSVRNRSRADMGAPASSATAITSDDDQATYGSRDWPLDTDPVALVDIYRNSGNSRSAADSAFKPYRGQWLKVMVKIERITIGADALQPTIVYMRTRSATLVVLRIPEEKHKLQVAKLRTGISTIMRGQINQVTMGAVILHNGGFYPLINSRTLSRVRPSG